MNTFDSKCADPTAAPPDPRKHVNYVHGMVLGTDDLIQEFAYHQHQRYSLARDGIGYGTLSGLRVTFESDLKVHVSPGTALSPKGQLIRVVPEQCAEINKWLDLAETREKIKNLGNRFNVYVALCFRDCKVDELPVPGEPCRCEDQAKAPSRILDDFRLELRLDPPAQREEDAVRDFVDWLRQIKVSDGEAASGSVEDFLNAIRSVAEDYSPPLESSPDFLYGSPPQDLVIPRAQLCEYLRAALKLWVVELRPRRQAQWTERVGGGCGCHEDERTEGKDAEECLLLAALNLTLTAGQVANASNVAVDDSRRPFVVHLRMLQEMLLCGPCCGGGCNDRTFASVFALDEHTLRIWINHPVPVTFDETAVQLEIDDSPVEIAGVVSVAPGTNVFDLDLGASPPVALQHGQLIRLSLDTCRITELVSPPQALNAALSRDGWCYPDFINETAHVYGIVNVQLGGGTGVTDHGDLTGLADDDHSQYLLVNGGRALTGDLSVGGNRLTTLGAALNNGDAVRFEQAIKNGDAAAGDLGGTYPNPNVQALQGRTVAPTAPAGEGDLLTWNASGPGQWEPRPAPSGGVTIQQVAEELPTLPFVTVTRGPRIENTPSFDLWFHLNAGPTYTRSNLPELTAFPNNAVAVFAETDLPAPSPPFLTRRAIKNVSQIDRNVFRVLMAGAQIDKDLLLRFIFTAADLGIRRVPGDPEIPASLWMTERPVKWDGHDGAKTITAFFRNEPDQASSGYVSAAAGRFRRDGAALGRVLGGVRATPHPEINSAFFIKFSSYDPENTYIVTGSPVLKIPTEDKPFVIVVGELFTPDGILIWLRPDVPSGGFMIQVHHIV
jgi:hypothetical protein